MDGLILVDKPEGWTSHDAAAYIRGAVKEKRVGHTGTLDPAATGLLLVLVGKATRLARYYGSDEKGYLATMKLGSETDTQDREGSVVRECPVPSLTHGDVEAAFGKFRGEISQTPPMYSAIKHEGRPLYSHARAGKTVEVSARKVFIHDLRLITLDGPLVSFETRCSKGTYVRTLCKDMGEALGSCAHLASLRRIFVEGYRVEDALPLAGRPSKEVILKSMISANAMLPGVPAATLTEQAAKRVGDGVAPGRDEIAGLPPGLPEGTPVRVLDGQGTLLAMAEAGLEYGRPLRLKVVLV
jgi:tRNA pseudouridine55 synthase